MILLPNDAAAEVGDLNLRAGATGIRYRTYVLVTADQSAMASIATFVSTQLSGVVLDVLDGSLGDGTLLGVSPMALLEWLLIRLDDSAPRCLVHSDAVLSTWRASERHRVWWEQAAMIERTCPLFIMTARSEAIQIQRWILVGSFWVHKAKIDVLGPLHARHIGELLQEGH